MVAEIFNSMVLSIPGIEISIYFFWDIILIFYYYHIFKLGNILQGLVMVISCFSSALF